MPRSSNGLGRLLLRQQIGVRLSYGVLWACMPMGATDSCKIGVVGSTPIKST